MTNEANIPRLDGERLSTMLEADMRDAQQMDMPTVQKRLADMAHHAAKMESLVARYEETTFLNNVAVRTIARLRKTESGLANTLENLISGMDIQRTNALTVLDAYHKGVDADARAEVETSLHEAGITEDPEVDGGLMG
jgi:hypothetical protein